MKIRIADGLVQFATHVITAQIDNKRDFPGLSVRLKDNEIICYSDEDVNRAKEILSRLKISYSISPVIFTQEQKDKVSGVIYMGYGEAYKHLNGEIEEPQSNEIPALKNKLKQESNNRGKFQIRISNLESQIKDLTTRMTSLENK